MQKSFPSGVDTFLPEYKLSFFLLHFFFGGGDLIAGYAKLKDLSSSIAF